MLSWLISAAVLLAFVYGFLRWFEYQNVYQPTRGTTPRPTHLQRSPESVTFSTRDGVRLAAWFFPADPRGTYSDLAVVVNHGNGGNISHRMSLYELLLDLGVAVLAYDYRGFGESEGRPSESGTYLDAEAAVEWLVARGIPESRIVAHGESLGGGVAAELALRREQLRGVILRSTFTSIPDLGAELFPFLPVRLVSTIRYDTRAKLPKIHVPVLLLHSRADSLIPFHHAEANFAAATGARFLREIRGDHNDQPDASPDLYRAALVEFFEATRPARR